MELVPVDWCLSHLSQIINEEAINESFTTFSTFFPLICFLASALNSEALIQVHLLPLLLLLSRKQQVAKKKEVKSKLLGHPEME